MSVSSLIPLSIFFLFAFRWDGSTGNLGAFVGAMMLIFAGAFLLGASVAQLGRNWNRGVKAPPYFEVRFPYSFVRHPGYLGEILVVLGLSIFSRDWLVWLAGGISCAIFYPIQIMFEEANLILFSKGYSAYFRIRKRLIPGVF